MLPCMLQYSDNYTCRESSVTVMVQLTKDTHHFHIVVNMYNLRSSNSSPVQQYFGYFTTSFE